MSYVLHRVGMGAVEYSGSDPETKRLADAANLFYAKGNTERGDYFAAKYWARETAGVDTASQSSADEQYPMSSVADYDRMMASDGMLDRAASRIGTGLMVAGVGLGAVVLYGIYRAVTR